MTKEEFLSQAEGSWDMFVEDNCVPESCIMFISDGESSYVSVQKDDHEFMLSEDQVKAVTNAGLFMCYPEIFESAEGQGLN
jgi:hypothetical protein